MEARTCFEF